MRFRLICLALLATTLPALASPRKDSLAAISRCAALPDDRSFLNCVYGAVQPMRASLGLPPALPSQLALVPPARALPSAPPVAPFVAAPNGASPPTHDGGLFGNLLGSNSLRLTSYGFDSRGFFRITLSDGQVWRQAPDDTNFAHWGGRASELWVSLSTQDGNTGRLSVRGDTGVYIVQRVR